jgi:hypothetical protein
LTLPLGLVHRNLVWDWPIKSMMGRTVCKMILQSWHGGANEQMGRVFSGRLSCRDDARG